MMRKAWHVLTAVGLGAVALASSVRGQPAGYEPTGLVPHALTIADFNGDGVPDLAVPAAAERKVTIFLSDGKGGFAERFGYPTGVGPSWVETGDWNGDGKLDLVTANTGGGTLTSPRTLSQMVSVATSTEATNPTTRLTGLTCRRRNRPTSALGQSSVSTQIIIRA